MTNQSFNIDERIDGCINLRGFGTTSQMVYEFRQKESIKQLLRDVLEYVKPSKRNAPELTPPEAVLTHETLQHAVSRCMNAGYDNAIDKMDAKAKELRL